MANNEYFVPRGGNPDYGDDKKPGWRPDNEIRGGNPDYGDDKKPGWRPDNEIRGGNPDYGDDKKPGWRPNNEIRGGTDRGTTFDKATFQSQTLIRVVKDGQEIVGEPEQLIRQGLLTPATIRPEDKPKVLMDIMYGHTNNKNLLAAKISLIMDSPELIDKLLTGQLFESKQEIDSENRGFNNGTSTINRKFQFLATLSILMKKGLNLSNVKIGPEGQKIGIQKAVEMFKGKCDQAKNDRIENPIWEPNAQGMEDNSTKSASVIASKFCREFYNQDKGKYAQEYLNFLATTRLPKEDIDTYSSYLQRMHGVYLSQEVANSDLAEFQQSRGQEQSVQPEQQGNNEPEL